MDKAIWFWIIYVICVVLGGWILYPTDRRILGGNIIVAVLLFILGVGVFGWPIK